MRKFIIFLISIYHRFLSPLNTPVCRYIPTCSEYTAEAVQKQGVRKGLIAGMRRMCRCHPFTRHSIYDPVIKT